MWYWIKTNAIIKKIGYNQIWSMPKSGNSIYLTFDDGPTPEITEWVLQTLQFYGAKATFFCIGNNIEKHPEIANKVLEQGHAIGNHTHNHVNGWKTQAKTYIEEVLRCATTITEKVRNSAAKDNSANALLFRPPYGKITPFQSRKLRAKGYKIIMWDVLTADFDTTISPQECYRNATTKVESGSIIVFHDSQKAFQNLQYVLPKALAYYKSKGFQMETL